VEAGVGVVVVVALVALAAGSFQRHEEPSTQVGAPSTTPAPSTIADRPVFRPLAGVPLAGPARLRLLVASEPRPFVVDLDQGSLQPVTGLPTNGERVVSALPVGEHAVIISEPMCSSCRPPGPEVYGSWRHTTTTTVRLGTAQEVMAARDGRAVWPLAHQTTSSCTLRQVGLDGQPRRPARPISCTTKPLAELPAGLLVASGTSEDPWEWPTSLLDHHGHRTRLGFPAANLLAATGQLVLTSAEPLAPLTLTNLRSRVSWRLGWPSRLRGGTHIAAVHPTAATSPSGSTGWPRRARKATTCGCSTPPPAAIEEVAASHASMVSQPEAVTRLIPSAVEATAAARP
jgi:hypothetical protein